jgi:hypothetical protein
MLGMLGNAVGIPTGMFASDTSSSAARDQRRAAEAQQESVDHQIKAERLQSVESMSMNGDADTIADNLNQLFTKFAGANNTEKQAIIEKASFGMMKLKKADPEMADFFKKKFDKIRAEVVDAEDVINGKQEFPDFKAGWDKVFTVLMEGKRYVTQGIKPALDTLLSIRAKNKKYDKYLKVAKNYVNNDDGGLGSMMSLMTNPLEGGLGKLMGGKKGDDILAQYDEAHAKIVKFIDQVKAMDENAAADYQKQLDAIDAQKPAA